MDLKPELCRAIQAKPASFEFFDPIRYLHWRDDSFRQMGVDGAGSDVQRVLQFRSGKLLRLSLVWKCFGAPCKRPLPPWQFKRDVPHSLAAYSAIMPPRGRYRGVVMKLYRSRQPSKRDPSPHGITRPLPPLCVKESVPSTGHRAGVGDTGRKLQPNASRIVDSARRALDLLPRGPAATASPASARKAGPFGQLAGAAQI